MSQASTPDRRLIFNAIVGVLVLGIAAVLFWPRGGRDTDADSLVLTPQDLSAADSTSTPLQASVETVPIESSGESVSSSSFATPPSNEAAPQTSQPQSGTESSRPIRPATPARSSLEPGSSGRFFLVVGSYAESSNAQREVRRLTAAGIDAQSVPASTPDGSVHRIHVGYFQSQADAEAYGRKLKQSMGLDYWVGTR